MTKLTRLTNYAPDIDNISFCNITSSVSASINVSSDLRIVRIYGDPLIPVTCHISHEEIQDWKSDSLHSLGGRPPTNFVIQKYSKLFPIKVSRKRDQTLWYNGCWNVLYEKPSLSWSTSNTSRIYRHIQADTCQNVKRRNKKYCYINVLCIWYSVR